MIADVKLFLGNGLYTVPEAAFYARVRPKTMNRWTIGNRQSRSVLTRQIDTDQRVVSFLDFVQTLAIRNIRLKKKIPLQKIREAMRFAENTWQMQFPFAMQHTTYLWGTDIVISPPNRDQQEVRNYVESTGKHKGSVLLTPIVEMYLEDLHFDDPVSGLAQRYDIFQRGDVTITMNPHRRFGEPLLPSGYAARTIWDAVDIEGGIQEAATAFAIAKEEVQAAMHFLDHLSGNAA
jgi:hypothetical protein